MLGTEQCKTIVKGNWPDSRYGMLRKALTELIKASEERDTLKARVEELEEILNLKTSITTEMIKRNKTIKKLIIEKSKITRENKELKRLAEIGEAIIGLMGNEVVNGFIEEWKARNEVNNVHNKD